MGRYAAYYPFVKNNQEVFENLLEKLKDVKDFQGKVNLACFLLYFATKHNTGYFTSSVLEKFFTDYAKSINIKENDISYVPNSFLHVMTQGSLRGGHTRVVERWIDNAPKTQKHSVVFTKKLKYDLSELKKNIKNKNGEYICLDKGQSLEEKALELRRLGLSYQYVICHTDMDDPTATVAFGTEKFTRPVAFYNHASHMFWIGKSIADIVLDVINEDELTKINRNIKNAFFMGIPSKEIIYENPQKEEIRKKLNLPTDKKIIVSAASTFKYHPIGKCNMISLLEKIIDENTYCYVIGPSQKERMWREAYKKSNGHITALGYVNFDAGFLNYMAAADVCLDSYPSGSATVLIDAISQATPCVSFLSFDYIKSSMAFCRTEEEYVEKALKILNDKVYAAKVLEDLQMNLKKYQSKEAWQEQIKKLLQIMPETHHVLDLSGEKDYHEIADISVSCNIMTDKQFLKRKSHKLNPKIEPENLATLGVLMNREGIPYIFEILKYQNYQGITKLFKVFGIKLPFQIKK